MLHAATRFSGRIARVDRYAGQPMETFSLRCQPVYSETCRVSSHLAGVSNPSAAQLLLHGHVALAGLWQRLGSMEMSQSHINSAPKNLRIQKETHSLLSAGNKGCVPGNRERCGIQRHDIVGLNQFQQPCVVFPHAIQIAEHVFDVVLDVQPDTDVSVAPHQKSYRTQSHSLDAGCAEQGQIKACASAMLESLFRKKTFCETVRNEFHRVSGVSKLGGGIDVSDFQILLQRIIESFHHLEGFFPGCRADTR